MRQFLIRMAGIFMLLSTILLLDGLAAANLPLLAAFCLLPLSVLLTVRLLREGAHSRARKRRRSSGRYQQARRETATLTGRRPAPALQVAAAHKPGDPWAAA